MQYYAEDVKADNKKIKGIGIEPTARFLNTTEFEVEKRFISYCYNRLIKQYQDFDYDVNIKKIVSNSGLYKTTTFSYGPVTLASLTIKVSKRPSGDVRLSVNTKEYER